MKTPLPQALLLALLLAGCSAPSGLNLMTAAPEKTADLLLDKPAQDTLYLGIVSGLIKQERYQAALAFLDQYAAKGTPSPRYQLLRGDAFSGAKRYDDALSAYTLAIRSAVVTDVAEAYNGLGRAQAAQEQWPQAVAAFRLAAQYDPTNAEYLNNLGYAGLQQKAVGAELTNALTDLKKAYELQPGSTRIRNNLILATALANNRPQMSILLNAIGNVKERATVEQFAVQWVGGNNKPDDMVGIAATKKQKAVP